MVMKTKNAADDDDDTCDACICRSGLELDDIGEATSNRRRQAVLGCMGGNNDSK